MQGEVPRVLVCDDIASCTQALAPGVTSQRMQVNEHWVIVTARENAIETLVSNGATVTVSVKAQPCPTGTGRTYTFTSSIYRVKASVTRAELQLLPAPDCGPADVPGAAGSTNRSSPNDAVPVRFRVSSAPCPAQGEEAPVQREDGRLMPLTSTPMLQPVPLNQRS